MEIFLILMIDMNKNPSLSILIPAYEYSFGVKRILDSVLESNLLTIKNEIEILISDDSHSDTIKQIIKSHEIQDIVKLVYVKRDNVSGIASSNWNNLLRMANGKYILFMHHDEFPYGKNFFNKLLRKIIHKPNVDIFLLRCNIKSLMKNKYRPHVFDFIKKIYFASSESIYLRNTIGSPSCVVIKKEKCPKFDERLKWIVDLDWYYKILNKKKLVIEFTKLNYISVNRTNSISNKIKSNVAEINNLEREIVKNDYSPFFVDTYKTSKSFMYKIFILCESFLWYFAKILTIPFGYFFILDVDKKFINKNDS